MSSSNYLELTSAHVNSLIDYVLDTKPYHVKLSQVIDEYLFEEMVNVTAIENYAFTIFLGADIVSEDVDVGDRLRSESWQRTLRSNGILRTYQLPLVSHPKFLRHVSQDNFVAGTDDYFGIPGLALGSLASPYTAAFSPRRWDGPGITNVSKNGATIQEGWAYFISHGAFSFNTLGSSTWKESNTNPNTADSPQPNNPDFDTDLTTGFTAKNGTLTYSNVYAIYGSIVNITGNPALADYNEWVLVCTNATLGSQQLSVYKSTNLTTPVGTANFNVPFSYVDANTAISFTFAAVNGDTPGNPPPIALGDTFRLTPSAKITVHPTAPLEIWSLIKVNPACLKSAIATPVGTNVPTVQVFCRDLHVTPASFWQLTFTGEDEYQLAAYAWDELTDTVGAPLAGYPKTVQLVDGCAFKDELMHLCFIPTTRGFQAGDLYSFKVGADKPTFLVFGSTSGFAGRAEIDKWFWNGKIGFKVPELRCSSIAFSPTIAVAQDGLNFSTVISSDQVLTEVTYVNSNNGFLTTGEGSIVAYSLNGYSWQSDVSALAMDTQRAIVVGENGFIAMTSREVDVPTIEYGWYQRTSHTAEDLTALVFIPGFFMSPPPTIEGIFVVVGDAGTVVTSANGDAWMVRPTGTTRNLTDIDWAGTPANIMVAVGDGGTIITSTDTITWTPRVSGTLEDLKSVIYAPDLSKFYIVGGNGTILSSSNGTTWTPAGVSTSDNLLDIAYRPVSLPDYPNGQLVAIGEDGTICSSIDAGVNWTVGGGAPFKSIAFSTDEDIFVVVGGGPVALGQFAQLAPVHPMIEPCVYTVTFVSSTQAVVKNNLYGVRSGLTANVPWSDEFVSFAIFNSPQPFARGDVVKVFVSPETDVLAFGGYDELPYDTSLYDMDFAVIKTPRYLHQHFPLWHSHGAVIVGDADKPAVVANRLTAATELVIDKALFELVRLKLPAASAALVPELAATDGWIPLEFRYVDRVNSSGSVLSTAEFSDVATRIDAYLASDPSYLVFSLIQPRYKCTDLSQGCVITFSPDFTSDFLSPGTNFTLQVQPAESYGQRVRVKVTENLSIKINYVDATPDVKLEIETQPLPNVPQQLTEIVESFTAAGGQQAFVLPPRALPYLVTAVTVNGTPQVETVDYVVNYPADTVTLVSPATVGDAVVVTLIELPF